MVLSLLYCLLLQLLVAPLVWSTLLLTNLGLIACTLLSFQKARTPAVAPFYVLVYACPMLPINALKSSIIHAQITPYRQPVVFSSVMSTLQAPEQAGMLVRAGTVGAQLSATLTEAAWDPSDTDRHYWQVAAWVLVGLSAAALVLTLLLAPRVKVAIAALRVGSRALRRAPGLLGVPLATGGLTGGFLIWYAAPTTHKPLIYSCLVHTCQPLL